MLRLEKYVKSIRFPSAVGYCAKLAQAGVRTQIGLPQS
jgi:hypothetical protein